MDTLTTHGITISVETFYNQQHSVPAEYKYVYAYRVTIENNREQEVQLLRRHWIIQDSNGIKREVKGEGVIGEQPVLQPGQNHVYVSWCPLETGIGKMYGTFTMLNKETNIEFEADIPAFKLIAPFKNN